MAEGCIGCGGVKFSNLIRYEKFPLYFGAFPAERVSTIEAFPLEIGICLHCGLIQQTELLDERLLDEVYKADYYNCPSPRLSGMGVREIDKFASFFSEIDLNKGKLLEIGCFDGYLLSSLDQIGWDVYGCDPSPVINSLEKVLGQGKLQKKFFDGELYEAETFDVVLFRNLLEHLYHPHQFLEAVRKCLKPNGHIVVDVPNVNALMEFGCYGLFFHQHITYFSLETLEKLLAKHGFAMTTSHEGNPNLFVCASRGTSLAPRLQEVPVVKNFEEKILNQSEKIKSQIDDIFSNKENLRIGLFGASALATTLIQHIDSAAISRITHIFDSDTEKHGKKLYGCDVKITGYERAQGNLIDCIVITTYFFDAEVRSHLLCEEFPSRKIVVLHESN